MLQCCTVTALPLSLYIPFAALLLLVSGLPSPPSAPLIFCPYLISSPLPSTLSIPCPPHSVFLQSSLLFALSCALLPLLASLPSKCSWIKVLEANARYMALVDMNGRFRVHKSGRIVRVLYLTIDPFCTSTILVLIVSRLLHCLLKSRCTFLLSFERKRLCFLKPYKPGLRETVSILEIGSKKVELVCKAQVNSRMKPKHFMMSRL